MPFVRLAVGKLDTNCYIVFDDQNKGVIIDPGDDAHRILDAVEERQLKIEYVMLTHVHFDHMLALEKIQSSTKAGLLVPRGDVEALSDSSKSLMFMAGRTKLSLKADRLLDDGDIIAVGKLSFRVIHTPGHTPGSSCYLCDDLLITGDTLFAGGFGRTDFAGGDNHAMRRSLVRLSELKGDYTVLPGHGEITTLDKERLDNPYMRLI